MMIQYVDRASDKYTATKAAFEARQVADEGHYDAQWSVWGCVGVCGAVLSVAVP